jgi:putative nucleotidyltransferase with HDIG domain
LVDEEVEIIGWAALLHDIGKLGIPKSILHKPGPLTKQEWKVIKLHPKVGARLLDHIQPLNRVKAIILAHHEEISGSGYPLGLIGENIPIGARIVAVVDAYTAMTEEHAYRAAMTHEQAVQEIRNNSGTHFDPLVVDAFLDQFH